MSVLNVCGGKMFLGNNFGSSADIWLRASAACGRFSSAGLLQENRLPERNRARLDKAVEMAPSLAGGVPFPPGAWSHRTDSSVFT